MDVKLAALVDGASVRRPIATVAQAASAKIAKICHQKLQVEPLRCQAPKFPSTVIQTFIVEMKMKVTAMVDL